MKGRPDFTLLVRSCRIVPCLVGCWTFAYFSTLTADVLREQTIQIQRGWNSVHLEVEPVDAKPAAVFAGKPVDTIARYFRRIRSVEFISDPSDQPWKQEGWGVWYAPDREDAFLTNLHAIQGNQSYLLHATEAFQWKITGKVRHQSQQWRTNSYNLVGFGLDSTAPPTFGTFFANAGGKIGQKIYRLQNGKWIKILDPANTPMRSGEAFWTWCEGKTDYQGPLQLKVPATGLLDFGARNNRLEVQWHSANNTSLKIESVQPAASNNNQAQRLPLHSVSIDSYAVPMTLNVIGVDLHRSRLIRDRLPPRQVVLIDLLTVDMDHDRIVRIKPDLKEARSWRKRREGGPKMSRDRLVLGIVSKVHYRSFPSVSIAKLPRAPRHVREEGVGISPPLQQLTLRHPVIAVLPD